MIVIHHLQQSINLPYSVIPLRNELLALQGMAYTDKAFMIELERLRKLADKLPRMQLSIDYSPDGGSVLVHNKKNKKTIMYFKAPKIENFRVEDLSGELHDFETQADRALYRYASDYVYGIEP